jgi:hypothetical protein
MSTADMEPGTMIEDHKAVHVITRLYAISIERKYHMCCHILCPADMKERAYIAPEEGG